MKIHAFKVVCRGGPSLDEVLKIISGLPLEERMRTISGGSIRLENANRVSAGWFLDFGGLRPEGPGRGSPTAPITDIELAEDELFGQETAAFYDPVSEFIILQYNHFGPRSGRIQGYFYRFSKVVAGQQENDEPSEPPDGFTLVPVMKSNSAEVLNRAAIVKNIDITVYVPGMRVNPGTRRRSLGGILDNPLVGSSDVLQMRLTAGRPKNSSLSITDARQLVTDLLGLREYVADLRMTVRESEGGQNEPLDLLEARLESDVRVERTGARYGRNKRWQAVKQAFDVWSANGQLE